MNESFHFSACSIDRFILKLVYKSDGHLIYHHEISISGSTELLMLIYYYVRDKQRLKLLIFELMAYRLYY